MYKPRKTASAIAALLGLASVGIEDTEGEICIRALRRLQHQHLITADPEATSGDPPDLLRRELDLASNSVEHDEIIAKPVHLGER